jgi:hypothetical protein
VYVGKASADRQRVNAHRGKSCEHNSLLQKWKVAIRRQGLTPEVVEVAFFKYDRLAIRVEKELIDSRTRGRRYTHEDQQIEHAGDLGFEYVAGLADKEITWGTAKIRPAVIEAPTESEDGDT